MQIHGNTCFLGNYYMCADNFDSFVALKNSFIDTDTNCLSLS